MEIYFAGSISGGMNCDKHGVFLTFVFHSITSNYKVS